ncbi:unnamed protein product [Haemonchus placei]|uniref:Ig-like domain-containing protein n=1 Tax=Haemonchus placei TaxID=6290 RepID=A0A0N4WTH3_HAEPC|nr:unnamed protein product [Haemonchus placei]
MNGRYLLLTSILLEALCYGVASGESLILKRGAKFNLICEGYRTTLYDCRWDFEDKDGNVKGHPPCGGAESAGYASESGVYKCYVKGPNDKEFRHTSTIPVTVFKDAPQKPKVVLKKIDVRPRGIEISWEAESIEYVPTRKYMGLFPKGIVAHVLGVFHNICPETQLSLALRHFQGPIKRIKVYVTKAGFPEELVTETAEQSGNVTYAVNNEGGRFIVTVTDTFVDDLTSKSEEEEVSFETVDDIKVIDLKHEVDLNDITLKWDATGMRKDEQPVYEVRVMTMKKGSKVLNKTIKATEKITKWKIEYRPEKYFVIVVATIGLYEGPPSTEVTVDVTELAPTDTPSVVGAKVNSPAEVYIMFKPLPLDKLPGIDLGCKVYLCLEQRVNIDCKVKTAGPRVDKVLYEDLIGGRRILHTGFINVKKLEGPGPIFGHSIQGVYWASVQCLTGAGPSPMSSWISVDVAKSVVAPRGKGIGARRADGKYVLDRILTEDRGLRSVDAGPGKTKAGKAAKGTPKKKKGKQKSKDSKSKDSKSKDSKSKDSKSKDSRSKDSKGSKEAEKQEEK